MEPCAVNRREASLICNISPKKKNKFYKTVIDSTSSRMRNFFHKVSHLYCLCILGFKITVQKIISGLISFLYKVYAKPSTKYEL